MLEWKKNELKKNIEVYSMNNKRWKVHWNPETGEGKVLYHSRSKHINKRFSQKTGNVEKGKMIPKYVIELIEELLYSITATSFDIDSSYIVTESVLSRSVKEEIKRQREMGLPIRTADAKGVYDLYPDNSKVYITD